MTTLPSEYQVAYFKSKNAPLEYKKCKLEEPSDGQILVKVLACGVCHSDHGVQTALFGNGFPIIPGHEIVGDIVVVSGSEKRWKVGDRVGGPWHGGHDGTCRSCMRGLYQICEQGAVNGVTRDGGYGEYVILRAEAGVRIPKDADPAEIAPLLCAGVTVFNGIRKQNVTTGARVAVVGLGGLGHLALQFVRKMGYRCIAISSSANKKEFALKLGAHDYIDSSGGDVGEQLQAMGGVALIVLTAPSEKQIPSLLRGLEPLGKLLILATAGEVKIDATSMIQFGTSICAWPSGHTLDCEETIDFATNNDIHCIVEKYPLEKASEAFDWMLQGKMRFRGVLIP